MIPDQWYAVLESKEVPAAKPKAFRRLGQDLVFWRDGAGNLSVMPDRCPHRSAQLSLGKVVNGNIECPFHGFQFNTAGQIQLIPANGRNGNKPAAFQCHSYPVREVHGIVWLWNGPPREQYPSLPWFPELDALTNVGSFQATWDTHYTRAIEGMLDVSHLPFVHRKTIGRRNATLVNGPYTTLENGRMLVWYDNQPDAGLPALKPTEMPPPAHDPMLHFNFPNVWHIRLGAKMRILNLIVPVDDENTVIYSRTYQGFVRMPVLRKLTDAWFNLFNRYVLNEDYGVARSQRPKKSDLHIGELFIPADRPIALYLQHRRKLIEAHQRTV